MMNNLKFIYSCCLIIFMTICSCTNRNQRSVGDFNTVLNSITINHVVEKREGCRFSLLEFNITIINKTNQTRHFSFEELENVCDRNIVKSNVNWVRQKEKLPLVINNIESPITVNKNDSVQINLESAFTVRGTSIKNILSYYEDWFSSGKVIYENTNRITFEKADDFNVILMVDDSIVKLSDTNRLNKSLTYPPDSLKIDSVIGEVPKDEPKL